MAKIYGNTTTTPLNPEKFGSTGKPFVDYMLLTSDNLLDDTSTPQKFIFQEDCTFYNSRGGALDFILKAQAGTVLYATFKPKVLGGTQLRIYEFIGSVTTQQSGTPPFEYSRNIIVEYDTGTGELTIREPKMDKFADVTKSVNPTTEANETTIDFGRGLVRIQTDSMQATGEGGLILSGYGGSDCLIFHPLHGVGFYSYESAMSDPDSDTKYLQIKVGVPQSQYEATNKKYVDTAIGSIETALDSIIAIQNQLIGGGE